MEGEKGGAMMRDIFENVKPVKFSWWIRFLLFFRKPFYGCDFGYNDPKNIVCMKELFGKYYITYNKLKGIERGKDEG